jgi:hypothetical protein
MFRRPSVSLGLTILAATAIASPALGQTQAAPPATQPALDPQQVTEFLADQRTLIRELLGSPAPQNQPRPIHDVVRLDIEDGHLVAREMDRKVPDKFQFRLRAPDEGAAFFHRIHFNEEGKHTFSFRLVRLNPTRLDTTHVEVAPVAARLMLTITIDTPTGTNVSELVEQWAPMPFEEEPIDPSARVRFSRHSEVERQESVSNYELEATSFSELIDASGDELTDLFAPGLLAMQSMSVLSGVGEAEARVILESDSPLDHAVTDQLTAMLGELEARGASAIPELRSRLSRFGSAAVLHLQTVPRDTWSADLSLNVDTLCANILPTHADRARRLLESPARLVNLLYAHDPAIRTAALKRLAVVVEGDVKIDPALDPYTQVEAIESLRLRLTSGN